MAKNKLPAMMCAAALFLSVLAGCVTPVETRIPSPSTEELALISPAVGYLAARAEACEGFLYVADAGEGESGFAYVYESAVALIALSSAGADWHVQLIADALVWAMDHDRYFDDGRLRNAYVGGNPHKESGWSFVGGAESVRLPGIWKDGRWLEDYYAVSTSTGNMAWAILALCEAARSAPPAKAAAYSTAAVKAADFVMLLRSDTGGFTGGYEGWDKEQTKAMYKSTEHNIDLISAFSSLAELLNTSDPAKAAQYRDASVYAEAFVLTMYDEERHCFYTGTEDDGLTLNKGVLPLDTNTWAILALGDSFADAELVVSFVEENIAVGDGFDFSAEDLNGIWHEGTAQMAVCYKILGNSDAYTRVMAYLDGQTAADGSITAADRDGLSTGFMVSGTNVMWQYDNQTNLGATSWLALAQLGANPLHKRS
ncbi:MAG: hypothetical protein FWG14_00770 [Peptococcaceae bacterium]|nr:hypothetical protein [Peptococcaceae bacterium]